jgi:insertion element IS1 protein InsB
MTCIAVQCPHCDSAQIVKRGKTHSGTQRSLCQNVACATGSVLLADHNRGCWPAVQHHIMARSLNASGVRDTARVLRLSTDTVFSELKKTEAVLESVNTTLLRPLKPDEIAVDIQRAGEAERDDMWSFVGKQGPQRWLWPAIDHHTGAVLAYVFGRRKDEVFLPRKALREPCGLARFSTDSWGAYTRHLAPAVPSPGQRNTPQIARKPLTVRTRMKRLVRKTLCFSKTTQMHDIVIGLFVNRSAFGLLV